MTPADILREPAAPVRLIERAAATHKPTDAAEWWAERTTYPELAPREKQWPAEDTARHGGGLGVRSFAAGDGPRHRGAGLARRRRRAGRQVGRARRAGTTTG